jgi:hypothetical protein
MDSLDDSVLVAVARRKRVLWQRRFRRNDDSDTLKIALRFLRVDLALWADVFSGEVLGSGHVEVRRPFGRWREVLDVDRDVLIRFDPAVGEIGGSVEVFEPVVDDVRHGRSQLCTPAVLRIHVDDEKRAIADVGRLVKRTLFPRHPPFVFNTVACVGAADKRGRGAYTNPDSIWFNVFFGFYEIDAPKPRWSRPFGYESALGAESRIAFDDVARLGKSDWNYFSNWMYGVPLRAIEPYNGIDLSRISTVQAPRPERIGRTLWHRATLDGVDCVSTYQSDARGAARLVTNSLIDEVWRRAFGLPNPRPDARESFVPTTLRAEVRMSYREDDARYRTLICGGTAVAPVDEELLAAQMAAVQAVTEDRYADFGFSEA